MIPQRVQPSLVPHLPVGLCTLSEPSVMQQHFSQSPSAVPELKTDIRSTVNLSLQMLIPLLITEVWIASSHAEFPSDDQEILKPGLSEVRQTGTNASLGVSAGSPYMFSSTEEAHPFGQDCKG